ncbi:heavy metal translocating P-type ATPase [Granulicatella sp. zg-ZJ]|uniref:heavy metal translocating P-type ATPase n=1 Tax=Granulicatella sp. zg-ZJ TaxID=2678504 RepID=UPI0013D7EB70|nr:heavy metal translocating P-type ATPase [Granulicatella sp. zg-ZJ]NEW61923.1 heavy metal translocating P-type ATPase [Granulicatella sp. zg-ZJ]
MEKVYQVKGMGCAACASKIEKVVNKINYVTQANVNLANEKLYVTYTDKQAIQDVEQAVSQLGYDLFSEEETVDNSDDEDAKKKIVFSGILSLAILYISMGHMIGLPMLFENSLINAIVTLVLSIPIVWWGKHYYIVGFKNIWRKQPNMDSLVALGTSAAFLQGIIAIFLMAFQKEDVHVYIEAGAIVLTLVSLGKYFEKRAKKQTTSAIAKLGELAPKEARLLEHGNERIVPVENVRVGDIILSKAGEKIALDGVVIDGYAKVDESMITGESMPVTKQKGDKVVGASLNTNGALTYEVTHIGSETTLAMIMKWVEQAQGTKLPIAQLVDKVSSVFVPVVMFLALATLIGWLLVGESIFFAFDMMIAVLVIACPCALGLATPTAIMVAIGQSARQGILIKNGEALQHASQINTVILDKTGTITNGKPSVSDVDTSISEEDLFVYAASLEQLSTHPLAHAIVEKAKEKQLNVLSCQTYTIHDGKGISGIVNGKEVMIGNSEFIKEHTQYEMFSEKAHHLSSQGKTPLFVSIDACVVGIIGVADTIKSSSLDAIQMLQHQGIEVVMATGDNDITARAIAKEVGIVDVYSGVLPIDKADIVKTYQEKGKMVAMVGDGINDAVALTQADVGVAIGSGTDIAIEAADIVLMQHHLQDVVQLIDISKRTMKIIKENLFWAFAYNIAMIPIAMGLFHSFGVMLNPMLAGLAMSLSSVSVVLNALRLNRKRGRIS